MVAQPSIEGIIRRDLTPAQAEAALDRNRDILCIACAGSGKSQTLAYRVARLLHEGVAPEGIVAFTFTEKAAESIKRRIASVLLHSGLSPNLIGRMYVGTIHAYCQSVLGQADAILRQFDVLDSNRFKLYLISRYPELGIGAVRDERGTRSNTQPRYFDTIDQIGKAWQFVQDERIDLNLLRQYDATLAATLERLKACLVRDQFIDFSEMIRQVVDKAEAHDAGVIRVLSSTTHLLVDEYQDVSPCEERLIQLIRQQGASLFVVGDDDQAIYSFRGSDVNNILSFQNRYQGATTHTLSQNFRSTQAIVEVADSFIRAELGAQRLEKHPIAHETKSPRQIGVHWFENRHAETEWIADRIEALLGTRYEERDGTIRGLTPADFSILLRSSKWRYSCAFAEALIRRNIPFTLDGGRGAFDLPEVAALAATFEALRGASPTRSEADFLLQTQILPAFPQTNPDEVRRILTKWGRLIHPAPGVRNRVYPQNLVHELLEAFGIARNPPSADAMRGLGVFSRALQDVETVYLSVDDGKRFESVLNFLAQVAPDVYSGDSDDVVARPDAITISTVHKMKGLEFPTVFLADCERQRFPLNNRAYDGWIPTQISLPITQRGAYTTDTNAEARLFYTALTRAERYLYVTGAQDLGGRRAWRRSPFALRLQHQEIEASPAVLPVGLSTEKARRRVNENFLPTSFTEIRYYLRCPMDYRFRQRLGFSPAVPEMFGYGRAVHVAVEKLHERFPDHAPTRAEAETTAEQTFHLKHVFQSRTGTAGPYEQARTKAKEIAGDYAITFGHDFHRSRQVEARFEIPAAGCLITGSIDLLLKEDEHGNVTDAQVIDFKSMEGLHDPTENPDIEMTELALQVQLYAKAAREILGNEVQLGAIHFLKDNRRFEVPVDEQSILHAMKNVEWAVAGILREDFPMRPHEAKCASCDFARLCPKTTQDFQATDRPPAIQVSVDQERMVPALR